MKWCRKAAEQGDATAQLLLGALCHNGQGVPQDYVEALMCLILAAAAVPASKTEKSDQAVSMPDFVAAKMTPVRIAEAQNLAREWKSG